jgi:putative membrane protein
MTRLLLAGAACAALLAACNQERAPEPVDKAQDAASVAVGQVSAATVGANTVAGYVPAAAINDMYEIQASAVALERSQNTRLKALATALRTDHTAASNLLAGAVQRAAAGTALPTALDERRQGLIDNLRSASAADFDRIWLDQQIAAHNEALTLNRGFQDQDSPLAAHARASIPKIEAHLREAEAIKAALPA